MKRTRTQLLKTASNLKEATTKIKNAQETLTPEMVKEMAEDIMEISEVAMETAEEIAENVPAEEVEDEREIREEETEQIEVAQDETEEEKRKRKERNAQDEDDEDKDKIKELEAKLASMERKNKLADLAPKYAQLFPQSMHEAKMNEIKNSKEPLPIVEAKIKEATDIITNKTMVKVASMMDSPYDFSTSDGEEVNISSKM